MDARCRAQALIEFGLPRNWIALVIERLTNKGVGSLSSNELYMILKRAGTILRAESSVLYANADSIVIGNLYGKVESLQEIFSRFGWPSDVCYAFLGDYICMDNDQLQIDVFILLLIFKIVYPKHILLLRGSAECEHCAAELGLIDLLASSFTVSLYQVLKGVFKYLPLAVCVNSAYLLSNTSLSLEKGSLVDLDLVVRPCTTCIRGRNIWSLGLRPSRISVPDNQSEDGEAADNPVLMFLKNSKLLFSVRDGADNVLNKFGCTVEGGTRRKVISLVSCTVLHGKRYNGTVLAIHQNRACTFHSVDPRAAKPEIRLLMPLPE